MFINYVVHRVIEENEAPKESKTEQCNLCFSCAVKAVINSGEKVRSIIDKEETEPTGCEDCGCYL